MTLPIKCMQTSCCMMQKVGFSPGKYLDESLNTVHTKGHSGSGLIRVTIKAFSTMSTNPVQESQATDSCLCLNSGRNGHEAQYRPMIAISGLKASGDLNAFTSSKSDLVSSLMETLESRPMESALKNSSLSSIGDTDTPRENSSAARRQRRKSASPVRPVLRTQDSCREFSYRHDEHEKDGKDDRSASKDMLADYNPNGYSTSTSMQQHSKNSHRRQQQHSHELVASGRTSIAKSVRSMNAAMTSQQLIQRGPSPTTNQPGHCQVSSSDRDSLKSYENEPDFPVVRLAADCLHAQDYSKMVLILKDAQMESMAINFGLGLAYYKLRKYPDSIIMFNRMDQLATADLSEHGNIYLAHYYLGEIEFSHSRYRKAAVHYLKASKSYSTDTVAKRYRIVQPSRATICSKRGSSLRQDQQIMEAVRAYKEALSVAETKKDKLAVHTSLGNLYQSLGENVSAQREYEETIALAEQLNDFISQGWAYGNMGNACLGMYQKEKALKYLEKSLELTIQHEPTPQAIGRAYNNLGTAYQSLNELEKAQEYYDLALSQAIYGRDLGGQARVYGNCGNLLMIQKRFESAIVHYSEALSISTDRSTRSTAFHNRGCAYYEKAEIKKKGLESAPTQGKDNFCVAYFGSNVSDLPQSKTLTESLSKDYKNGCNDLTEVVQFHEQTFQTIKGSPNGLNLSVSLFETNSRSFHRLQDCLFSLGDWNSALQFAEQSRARTLGELLLQRKGGQLREELSSPLKMDQIAGIIESVNTIVIYLSYTGARLLAWIFTPSNGEIVTNRFQVALEDDQFEGKSLDYFLRYTLSEQLIEDSVEMYSHCDYATSPPLEKLFQLFGKPLLEILSRAAGPIEHHTTKDVILIPDSYTNLMPVVALLNSSSKQFLGDKFCFRIMPSLLTLGILSQLSEVVVNVPEESQNFCIVGNPTIPTFRYQGDTWNLGKLPFATQEAEAVAHILKSNPTLHEQATKMVVLSMISSAKVVHLATHGSAAAGFLAFAGLGSSRSKSISDESLVLLYPEDVEKLNISPALVVLSSCDSGRGAVKADGIQGMARAFILAGAQAVLTTLWRVPDESAAIFMQFFYQYLMDGFKGSHALHKAMLSIRSFKKYSRYIHWSGFQLTGREIQFNVSEKSIAASIRRRMGPCSVFPRLEVVKTLEKAFVKSAYLPTDVHVIQGVNGLKPLEPVVEFVNKNHQHFTGGIFFVSTKNSHYITQAEDMIKEELKRANYPQERDNEPILIILDDLVSFPLEDSAYLQDLLSKNNTHLIVVTNSEVALESFKKDVDIHLMRGTNITELKPLSDLHSTQRIVHAVMSRSNFIPYNEQQEVLAEIANWSRGSPELVEVISSLLRKYIDDQGDDTFLESFYNDMSSDSDTPDDFVMRLLQCCRLSQSALLVLNALSLLGPVPIPHFLVEKVELLALSASSDSTSTLSVVTSLISSGLLCVAPSPVIASPMSTGESTADVSSSTHEAEYYYIPQVISDTVCTSMSTKDWLFSFKIIHHCLDHKDSTATNVVVAAALLKRIMDIVEYRADNNNNSNEPKLVECYKLAYRTYLTQFSSTLVY